MGFVDHYFQQKMSFLAQRREGGRLDVGNLEAFLGAWEMEHAINAGNFLERFMTFFSRVNWRVIILLTFTCGILIYDF